MAASLRVWHLTPDAPRQPRRVGPGERVRVCIGTWPVSPGQSAWITLGTSSASTTVQRVDATWERNDGPNSYWALSIGPFSRGEAVEYTVHASDASGRVTGSTHRFCVGPKVRLALLWHQHQPMYRTESRREGRLVLRQPWVRLHALRDYYSMAALVAEQPEMNLTINLTPVLLAQIDDYVERGATDRQLELTLSPAERLGAAEREELLGSFFDADWHRQIFVHERYRELFEQRGRGEHFSPEDLRDVQMWFNLAWFGKEFRDGRVELVTGETVDVQRFVARGRGFSAADVSDMVEEQYKLLRAVVPIHRRLQERGQIEVSTTPLCHPILPLLIDTDEATVDLDGATLPRRFAHPEDADAQVKRAVADYERRFGRAPRGMWPAEGAVSTSSVPVFARHGIRWIASDRGVLAQSGRWGYRADDPDVLCRPYRLRHGDAELAIFFRDTALSDQIGFRYQREAPEEAARQFVREIEGRFVERFEGEEDRLVTVILDGENAWGGYADDGRPFLRALYARLAGTPSIQTVTFSEYLSGNAARDLEAHPPTEEVHELFTGSWIDEVRSRPGVDLGTWIGEPEENQAWELLGDARHAVEAAPVELRCPALDSIYAAEGSDWFWWFGGDQDSGNDEAFDELFRDHLQAVYRALGLNAPPRLSVPLVRRHVVWSFARPVASVVPGDELIVRTNCPGSLAWHPDDLPERSVGLVPVGGVLAGARRFQARVTIERRWDKLQFRFLCGEASCAGRDRCCQGDVQTVEIAASLPRRLEA